MLVVTDFSIQLDRGQDNQCLVAPNSFRPSPYGETVQVVTGSNKAEKECLLNSQNQGFVRLRSDRDAELCEALSTINIRHNGYADDQYYYVPNSESGRIRQLRIVHTLAERLTRDPFILGRLEDDLCRQLDDVHSFASLTTEKFAVGVSFRFGSTIDKRRYPHTHPELIINLVTTYCGPGTLISPKGSYDWLQIGGSVNKNHQELPNGAFFFKGGIGWSEGFNPILHQAPDLNHCWNLNGPRISLLAYAIPINRVQLSLRELEAPLPEW